MTELWRENLKKLRKQADKTQAQLASELKTTHQTISNWEKGSGFPTPSEWVEISKIFELPIEDIVTSVHPIARKQELQKGPESTPNSIPNRTPNGPNSGIIPAQKQPLSTAQTPDNTPQYGVRTPTIITLDSTGGENIVDVPVRARAGYLTGYGDQRFIQSLQAFRLPGLPMGTYRSFEVEGPSMTPTLLTGDRVVCRWVENFDQIRENRVHIVVTQDGIVAKRVLNRIEQRGKVVLKSDTITHRKEYRTYEIDPADIKEIWYAVFRLSSDFSEPAEIYHRVADLEADMVEIQSVNKSMLSEFQEIKERLAKKR